MALAAGEESVDEVEELADLIDLARVWCRRRYLEAARSIKAEILEELLSKASQPSTKPSQPPSQPQSKRPPDP